MDKLLADATRTATCLVCGWSYAPEAGDPDHGVPPGTAFADLPDDWLCPDCGVDKSQFDPAAC